MMNLCANDMPVCTTEPKEAEIVTLTELMGVANCMGDDALGKAVRIGNHLFGETTSGCEKKESKCYCEVMKEHCYTLEKLNSALSKIIDLLGC